LGQFDGSRHFALRLVHPIFEPDRDLFADARFLHRDAVEDVRGGHRFFRVGDEDELREVGKFSEDGGEAADVGFVEGGVDFVQEAERGRLAAEDGEEQGDGGQGFFAAGHEGDGAEFFARRAGDNFEAAFEDVVFVFENQVGHAAAKDFTEEFLEVRADGVEGFEEEAFAVLVDLGDDLFERFLGGDEVAVLGLEVDGTGFQVLQFGQGFHVDAAELREFLPQFGDFGLGGGGVERGFIGEQFLPFLGVVRREFDW